MKKDVKGKYLLLFQQTSDYKVQLFLLDFPGFHLVKGWLIIHIDSINKTAFGEYQLIHIAKDENVYPGFIYLDGITQLWQIGKEGVMPRKYFNIAKPADDAIFFQAWSTKFRCLVDYLFMIYIKF